MTTALIVLLSAAGPTALACGLLAERIAPPSGPARTAPALDTCAASGCTRPVLTGQPWCSGLCRHLDDPRDYYDDLWGDDEC
ncbi:hypothetical protein ACFSJS_22755 [Streptomyces desertarenae]|uniref:Secreted protein n=1 Tax=Streptomyces desertarenae TaxID=2666184 RepID=A0ABW4PQB5_9ACTN